MSDVGTHVRRRRVRALGRTISILLLTLGAGLAVASCGGDGQLSQQEYDRQLSEAGRDIESAFEGVREELERVGRGSASLDSAAEQLEEARGRLDRAADELEGLEPPDDAAQAHDELVQGLNELSSEFGEFRDALESGSVPRIQRFVQDFGGLDAVERIERAMSELESRGYEIPSLG